MAFVFLEARNVRILREVTCEPHGRLNLIFGRNASGKSSFLEAIGFLGLGRSFRTAQLEPVIRRGATSLSVFGRYVEGGVEHRVGVERSRGGRRIKVDQNTAATAAELAQTIPLQALGPDAQRIFFLEAQTRRQALAWSLFHVEPQFLPRWRAYSRLLKQRNAALRNGGNTAAWDHELGQAGEALGQLFRTHLTDLWPHVERQCEKLLGQIPKLEFDIGWSDPRLEDNLRRDQQRDHDRGFTHAGPHRADLVISLDGYAARAQASHGQQKLLLLAFRFAQIELLKQTRGRSTVLLVDDLATDLDREHRAAVIRAALGLQSQCFVTATEAELLPQQEGRAFHVEQGQLRVLS